MSFRTPPDTTPSLDSLWMTNLQLLGYSESGATLTLTMFDHSNPGAFQQVFHFLASLVARDRVKQEMRDCWPVLDKKQEAEFRRKVSGLLREWQKEQPAELPFVNPSLFQSPGGRKFKSFLLTFSAWVLKTCYERQKDGEEERDLLAWPEGKSLTGQARSTVWERLVGRQRGQLDEGTRAQVELVSQETRARDAVTSLVEEYINQKSGLEVKKEQFDVSRGVVRREHPTFVTGDQIDQESLVSSLELESRAVRQLESRARGLGESHQVHWESLARVLDQSRTQPQLNLSGLTVGDLQTTYRHLGRGGLATTDRVLEKGVHFLPLLEVGQVTGVISQQVVSLGELASLLETSHGLLKESVREKLATSQTIDWANCALAPKVEVPALAPPMVLLPPTPSLLPDLARLQDLPSPTILRLLSPVPPTDEAPTPAPLDESQTPTSHLVQRRFPRRPTPDQSPLLRQSLLQSTISSLRSESGEFLGSRDPSRGGHSDTKESIGLFSPVLSSTIMKSDTESQLSSEEQAAPVSASICGTGVISSLSTWTPSPSFQSLREEGERQGLESETNKTASKIENYKKVLLGMQTGQSALRPAKAGLLEVWNKTRESLSPNSRGQETPRTTRVQGTSWTTPFPLTTPSSPNTSLEMDSRLVTRLDQLMESLTLTDNSELDLSLGGLSVSPGVDLLSPHL